MTKLYKYYLLITYYVPFVILNGPNSVHTLDECNKLLAKYQNDEGGFCAMENHGLIRNEKIGTMESLLRKPDLRKNLNLRKIVGATNFLVHKLSDLRKIF